MYDDYCDELKISISLIRDALDSGKKIKCIKYDNVAKIWIVIYDNIN